jgi:riboflavin kinase/FMN adenylyltransferase
MLGHWHRIEGRVLHGDKRGRELGFPTANLALGDLHRPRYGVYACLVDVADGPHAGRYQGAASLGERPTFGINAPNLEVFLLDFAGDLYGAFLSVALVAFQRPELKFDGVPALVAQMQADVVEPRRAAPRTGPGPELTGGGGCGSRPKGSSCVPGATPTSIPSRR